MTGPTWPWPSSSRTTASTGNMRRWFWATCGGPGHHQPAHCPPPHGPEKDGGEPFQRPPRGDPLDGAGPLSRLHPCPVPGWETGRTHQIRVHMAGPGPSGVGGPGVQRACGRGSLSWAGQCLHARRLSFQHPRTGERMTLSSPLPAYFQTVLTRCSRLV